ncbi:alpha/beta hydrolase [Leucobacter sp. cx-42]|uniref:alpha/beta fold hydrolase n=1 Tax=unclassified Leucobacter TaxID=2621730 RepID=UPI00165E7B7B|nr:MULTISPECIES: alpha/beta hydrolase [unclassified Leucobacter]MBC9953955.1 alpha/beta hydrolase [Leucobacter sp. cx-42]
MTTTTVCIAGHWLGAWAWDEVRERFPSCVPMTLPGLDPADPDRATRTLEDQVAGILTVFAQHEVTADRPCVLVAHSGANGPVSLVLDRHPELVQRIVWVDSGPVASGTVFAPDLPGTIREVPLPELATLGQQASLDGLTTAQLERFVARAVPQPAPVMRDEIVLTNEGRHTVPTTFVCSSMPSAQVLELAAAGHPMFAEITKLTQASFVDLPTGHWPMWSKPGELASLLQEAAAS